MKTTPTMDTEDRVRSLTIAQAKALRSAFEAAEDGLSYHVQYGNTPPGTANLRTLQALTDKGLLKAHTAWSGSLQVTTWRVTDAGRTAVAERGDLGA